MFKRWLLRAGKWPWKAKKEKFHTCGGPRRRPCLGQGRGRRIQHYSLLQ